MMLPALFCKVIQKFQNCGITAHYFIYFPIFERSNRGNLPRAEKHFTLLRLICTLQQHIDRIVNFSLFKISNTCSSILYHR